MCLLTSHAGLMPAQTVRSIMVCEAPTSACRMARDTSTSHDHPALHVDKIVVGVGEERRPLAARWSVEQAGSDGDTNFRVASLAAPKAASSRVARYSCMARLAVWRSQVFCHF